MYRTDNALQLARILWNHHHVIFHCHTYALDLEGHEKIIGYWYVCMYVLYVCTVCIYVFVYMQYECMYVFVYVGMYVNQIVCM